MNLIENKYETAGLWKLPPHARDVAEELLTVTPLDELLVIWQEQKPDHKLLQRFHAPVTLWPDILNATLLAKTTYFILNPDFTRQELLYLMKIACASVNRPLDTYSIKEVIEMSQEDYPIFVDWLTEFASQLKQLSKTG